MLSLALPEVKKYLNITSDTHDAELKVFINAASALIADKVGPLEPTPTTALVRGGAAMVLPTAPVVSVTSAEIEGFSTIDLSACVVDLRAGIIHAPSYASATGYTYTVTYTAGWQVLPADLHMAVLELVRHLWLTQRGPSRRPGSAASETAPGAGFLLPNRVEQLIAPYRNQRVA